MAMTPQQAAAVFFGTSLFGLLAFSSGLMIGVGIGGDAGRPALAQPEGAPLVGKPPAAPVAAQAMAAPAPMTAPAAAVLVPMPQPAPAAAQPSAAPPAVAQAPAASGTTQAAAAAVPATMEPVAVKDFRVGLPLDVAAASPLRGRLVEAAQAAPRDLTVAPLAAAAPQAAAGPGSAAPAGPAAPLPAAATMPAAPPFVFSVQVGSFLVKANAERLVEELNKRGYAAQVLVAQSPGEPAWYPVVLPPVSDIATVARQAQEFADSEGRNAEVVSWAAK
jgi:SPOR domain